MEHGHCLDLTHGIDYRRAKGIMESQVRSEAAKAAVRLRGMLGQYGGFEADTASSNCIRIRAYNWVRLETLHHKSQDQVSEFSDTNDECGCQSS